MQSPLVKVLYLHILHEVDGKTAQTFASNTKFRFGDRQCVKSVKSVKIPALFVGREVFIVTDVADGDLPLLLSNGV